MDIEDKLVDNLIDYINNHRIEIKGDNTNFAFTGYNTYIFSINEFTYNVSGRTLIYHKESGELHISLDANASMKLYNFCKKYIREQNIRQKQENEDTKKEKILSIIASLPK